MTIEEIRELIALADETGVAELEVQRGEDRVRIRRAINDGAREIVLPARSSTPAKTVAQAPAAAVAPAEVSAADPTLVLVKSPIVGTFYESSGPGSPPFVQVGEKVQPGKVLCIIESMKLMNEIESEIAGIIETKLVTNGKPVEYGEALFAIRPI